MVFNATFNNISVISWWSVILVKENGVPGENYRPAVSHWKTLSHTLKRYINYRIFPFKLCSLCVGKLKHEWKLFSYNTYMCYVIVQHFLAGSPIKIRHFSSHLTNSKFTQWSLQGIVLNNTPFHLSQPQVLSIESSSNCHNFYITFYDWIE